MERRPPGIDTEAGTQPLNSEQGSAAPLNGRGWFRTGSPEPESEDNSSDRFVIFVGIVQVSPNAGLNES